MTQIAAGHISISKGGREILRDVSMSGAGGEFIAIIGPNGAGKSTLLASLAGLLKPDTGTVAIDGRALSAWNGRELARKRAYLPQNPRCEWPISVERLVALGLTPVLPVFGGFPGALRLRIDEVLAACDLLALRDQPATTLSGGELARAMLARTLVGDPDVLIFDEPLEGLDPRHTLATAERLSELARGGKLVIASMHDLTLAARHAGRIVALDRGRVAADGTPGQVLTSALIRAVFAVDARISTAGGGAFVDFLAPVAGGREQQR